MGRQRRGTCIPVGLALLAVGPVSLWWIGLAVLWIVTAAGMAMVLCRYAKRNAARHHEDEQELRKSETRFRQLAENIDEAFWLISPDEKELYYISPAYEVITGRSCQSLYGDPDSWLGTLHPEDRQRIARDLSAEPIPHNGNRSHECRVIRPNGEMRWVWLRSRPVYNEAGDFVARAGVAVDITERKRAEDALRASEEQCRSIIETAKDAVIVADHRGVITLWNKASETIFGYSATEAVGRPVTLLMPLRYRRAHDSALTRVVSGGKTKLLGRTVELMGLHKDGTAFPLELSLTKWHGARETYFTGIVRDITQRKQSDEALRESEQRFRGAFDHSAVGMMLVAVDGHFLRVNQAFCEMLGYAEDELRGKKFIDVTHPDDVEKSVEHVQRLLSRELPAFTLETRYVHKCGDILWGLTNVALVLDRHNQPLYSIAETQDITARKQVEEALRESEERFRQIAESISQVIFLSDARDDRIIYVSPAYEEIWKQPVEALYADPRAWQEAVHPEDRARVTAVLSEHRRGRKAFTNEYRIVRPDGSIRWVRDRVFPVRNKSGEIYRIAGMTEDITELARHRERLEALVEERTAELLASHERLRLADRLASIGTLTAGLGHDMNNVLFPIRCRLDALDWQRVPADLKDLLEATGETVNYLQQLSAGLRLLSADPQETEATAEVTSLPNWWTQVSPLITKVLPEGVKLESNFAADLPPIEVAPHSLTQAALNLTMNAAEAMPNGGLVRITAERSQDPSFVRVRVTDEGVGMTQRVRQRAFDPFFTTKRRSLSTGLGLSLVHAVVTSAGGTVELDSKPGSGTTVILTFPIARGSLAETSALNSAGHSRATVSLADQRIAAWVSSVLTSAGYEVLQTEDGDPADSLLWVTDPTAEHLRTARRLTRTRPEHQLVVLGPAAADWKRLGAIVVQDVRDLEAIRSAVHTVATVNPERNNEGIVNNPRSVRG